MFQINPGWFRVEPWFIIIAVICAVAFIVISVNRGVLAHRYRVSAGREELIGRTAEVKEALSPKGVVFVDGERWMAISEQGRVEVGEEVTITRVSGLKLWVTKNKEGGK